ncbi:hypothetical protein H9P43_005837 [Blastocladiella emersonii ATCC 22665]|nr:hypothetical protein H9P43_005837 [Blastocladiella emersonii ATCC 22665]
MTTTDAAQLNASDSAMAHGGEPPAKAPATSMANFYAIACTYLAFTLSDSALRMIVLLELFTRKFSPVEIALMFTLYELLGVFTNLFGGVMGSRIGLRPLLLVGLVSQMAGIGMLYGLDPAWSKAATTAYIAASQGLSGIAKDLVKMSGKSVTKLAAKPADSGSSLLRLVSRLTGAKNSVKGVGYFFGALLVTWGYIPALSVLLALVVLTFVASFAYVGADLGKSAKRTTLVEIVRKQNPQIRRLSLARMFLFGARDLWFEVPLPVFLRGVLGWAYFSTGAFLATWVIVYGVVQSAAPQLVKRAGMDPHSPRPLIPVLGLLAAVLALVAGLLYAVDDSAVGTSAVLIAGLGAFAALFGVASSLHSYLIVAYSGRDKVAANVGIYYCANAVGRLAGTVASGYIYSGFGLPACLWFSVGAMVVSNAVNLLLAHPDEAKEREAREGAVEEGVPLAEAAAAVSGEEPPAQSS